MDIRGQWRRDLDMTEPIINNGGKYGKYFLQELKLPAVHATPEAIAKYNEAGRKRVLWLDGAVIEGCPLQINTAYYYEKNHDYMDDWAANDPDGLVGKPHVHDVPELLCFYGTDPEKPYDLNGEVEIWIEGEQHILTKSTLIFIPAGMSHLPLYVNKVDRPIFHFSMLMDDSYGFTSANGNRFEAK